MERKIQPGMVTLTWTSMNIDGFLHRIHSGLFKLDDLVTKIRDVIENRIERNLKLVSQTLLVSIPSDESVLLDKFVSHQASRAHPLYHPRPASRALPLLSCTYLPHLPSPTQPTSCSPPARPTPRALSPHHTH